MSAEKIFEELLHAITSDQFINSLLGAAIMEVLYWRSLRESLSVDVFNKALCFGAVSISLVTVIVSAFVAQRLFSLNESEYYKYILIGASLPSMMKGIALALPKDKETTLGDGGVSVYFQRRKYR